MVISLGARLFAQFHVATVNGMGEGFEGKPGFLVHFTMVFQSRNPGFGEAVAVVGFGDLESLGQVVAAQPRL